MLYIEVEYDVIVLTLATTVCDGQASSHIVCVVSGVRTASSQPSEPITATVGECPNQSILPSDSARCTQEMSAAASSSVLQSPDDC